MMFFGLHKLRNICCGHKMFLNKIRNIFPGHKICVRNEGCARRQTGKHLCWQQCVLVFQGLYMTHVSYLLQDSAMNMWQIMINEWWWNCTLVLHYFHKKNFHYMKMYVQCRIRATDIQEEAIATGLYSIVSKFNQDIRFCFVFSITGGMWVLMSD